MKFKCIPGAPAHEIKDFKAALLHIGINDILKIKLSPDIEKPSTTTSLLEFKKIIISGLILNSKVEISFLEQVNYELLQFCVKN